MSEGILVLGNAVFRAGFFRQNVLCDLVIKHHTSFQNGLRCFFQGRGVVLVQVLINSVQELYQQKFCILGVLHNLCVCFLLSSNFGGGDGCWLWGLLRTNASH